MAVPTRMSDLSTLAASNSPTGTEAIGNSLDNYIRAHAQIIRSTNALASASIASASTVDVANADGESVSITGSATISNLGTGFNGCYRELRFAGACTLTHSSSLKLPGSTNITTAAGHILGFRCTGSGVWELVGGSPGGGTPLNGAATRTGVLTSPLAHSKDGGYFLLGSYSVSTYGDGSCQIWWDENNKTVNLQSATALKVGANAVPLLVNANTWTANQTIAPASGRAQVIVTSTTGSGGIDNAGNTSLFSTSGTLFLRPNGATDTTGQVEVNSVGAVTIGGGKKLSKITVSSAAPGTLADGELYLKY